jgi:hypothetical protein
MYCHQFDTPRHAANVVMATAEGGLFCYSSNRMGDHPLSFGLRNFLVEQLPRS